MKRIAIALLFLNLTACATVQNFTDEVRTTVQKVVTPDNFDSVTILYGSTLAVANGYYDLCEKKVLAKSCWKVIASLQPYEDKAYKSYIVLKNFVRNNPNLDASSFIRIAKDSIVAFRSMQQQQGLK